MDGDKAFSVGLCILLGVFVLAGVLIFTGWFDGPSEPQSPQNSHYSDLINPGSNVRYPTGM